MSRLRLVAALLCAGLSALAPAAGLAASPIKDPHGSNCPVAPSGWQINPGDAGTTVGGGWS